MLIPEDARPQICKCDFSVSLEGEKIKFDYAYIMQHGTPGENGLMQGYLDRYGLGEWAKGRYDAMPVKASACVECGVCETRCPYNLPIRQMLKEVAVKFGE